MSIEEKESAWIWYLFLFEISFFHQSRIFVRAHVGWYTRPRTNIVYTIVVCVVDRPSSSKLLIGFSRKTIMSRMGIVGNANGRHGCQESRVSFCGWNIALQYSKDNFSGGAACPFECSHGMPESE
jgi:hypothetical protein